MNIIKNNEQEHGNDFFFGFQHQFLIHSKKT